MACSISKRSHAWINMMPFLYLPVRWLSARTLKGKLGSNELFVFLGTHLSLTSNQVVGTHILAP